MKILVAGGAGYLGSVLIPKLLERGYKVDVVDLFWFGNHLPRQVGVLNKDIFHLTVEDLDPYDVVVFLAGLSNDPMAEYSPSKNFIFNAAAPAYLGYMAKMAGVKRYVYASSCSVYGYTENELYDETRPASSSYPYGISKLQGEQAAIQLIDEKFSVISLRKGTISGPSPRMRLDLIINTMLKAAMKDRTITVNNPSIWRPILSIDDAATAYIRAIEANEKISGFLPIEREWIDLAISRGYVDTFRHYYPDKIEYSWWDLKTRARERNVGWRIDYVFATREMMDSVKSAFILSDVMGSDHCPVGIELETVE